MAIRRVMFSADTKNFNRDYIMRLNEEDFIQFEGSSEWEQKEWCKAYLQNLIKVIEVEIIEEKERLEITVLGGKAAGIDRPL